MVADAFRIAFEQQLRKQNESFLFLTEANFLKSHQEEDEGKFISPVYPSIILPPYYCLQMKYLIIMKKKSFIFCHHTFVLKRLSSEMPFCYII